MRTIVLVLPLAAAALLAGCGGSSPKAGVDVTSGSPPPFTASDTATAPPTTAGGSTSSAPTGPAPCATTNLTVSLGAGQGAAGSTYYPLHFVNKSSSACTMTGYPGVSFVAPGNGHQVGAAATRSTDAAPTVTLAPGGEGTATVQIASYQDFGPAACGATAVSGLRIYPPANTAAAYVPLPGSQQACAKNTSPTGSSQLIIRPVKAGTTGI